MRRLEGDLFPELGTLPIAGIEVPLLIKVIKKIEARDALDVAYKAFEKCEQIMRYAIAHGLAEMGGLT